jgi:hypothetical protein
MSANLIDLRERLAEHLRGPAAPPSPEPALDTPTASTPRAAAPAPSRKLMVQRLTALVREVSLLGVRFHVQGPHLTITGREGLPALGRTVGRV